ncbi:MAG: adenine-specific DNA methylase [Candidatus Brocadia sp. WS118]|nr:MAG: adenine-specific DNA methylase [Candidatus Brocadia sp. WS118]
MNKYPKRLIEVDLPIKRISAHARREKSIRHGHISTLHIWWARRPLAACRAVICASLWPDPADELCPQTFRDKATELITHFAKEVMSNKSLAENCSEESLTRWNFLSRDENCLNRNNPAHLNILRFALLDLIADFANWDNSTVPEYLEISRALTHAAHEALGGERGTRPLVVDPFAGGGSIPLEALRVGASVFASDLNPVAVLLNKVILEYIPKYGKRLVQEVRKWGQWINDEAEKKLAKFYPKDPDGAIPIAYLWARTIMCEGPSCGAQVPLMRSLWLAKRKNKLVALRLIPNPKEKRVDFDIIEDVKAKDVGEGMVLRGAATCPCCGYTTPVASVRKQLKAQRGGANNARMFAVVTTRPGQQGRFYRLPVERDLEAVRMAAEELKRLKDTHNGSLSLVPNEPTPEGGGSGAGRAFSLRIYGMAFFEDLFTYRQALALSTYTSLIRKIDSNISENFDSEFCTVVQTLLAFVVNKHADFNSSLSRWANHMEKSVATFGRPALSMLWDWGEMCPLGKSTGSFKVGLEWIIKALQQTANGKTRIGIASIATATNHPLPDDSAECIFTDPPYYDAIPYSDLADYFYVWFKRAIGEKYLDILSEYLSPKTDECVLDEVKGHDRAFFEKTMKNAMEESRRILNPRGVGVVVFAHKSTSGWEAQLQAMLDAGLIFMASWPIDTEKPDRMRAMGSAALASSIHIVFRPRESSDGSLRTDSFGDWRDVLAELPKRIHEWMPRLAEEGVVGADAIFACLGPALEIFSRYSSVEKASGEKVTLKEYLEEVWAAVSREALNMIFEGADASGFEEDARLTAMWLWTLRTAANGDDDGTDDGAGSKSLAGYRLEFDAARKIAQGLGAHLEKLSHLVEIKGNTATLLSATARTPYLFGKDAAAAPKGKRKKQTDQLKFGFAEELEQIEAESGDWRGDLSGKAGNTVLDQLHQAMILFAAGRGEALKRFLVEDGVGRNPLFWRLAQALSALYPTASDEKRWVDGVLARKKGLGL